MSTSWGEAQASAFSKSNSSDFQPPPDAEGRDRCPVPTSDHDGPTPSVGGLSLRGRGSLPSAKVAMDKWPLTQDSSSNTITSFTVF